MIKDTYPYLPSNRKTRFAFQSEGPNGIIVKIIQFYVKEDGKWNLGFGDWKHGKVDDTVVSNNQDTMKILRTVAKATLEFFKENPLSIVIIEPVDERCKKLYNFIFQRHYHTIEPIFNLIGFVNGVPEPYSIHQIYDNFLSP